MAAPTGRTPILGLPYPISDDDVKVERDVKALADAIDAGATFIVGEVRFIALAAAPPRWLPCDGASLARAAYPALFAALGVTFGSVDANSFSVPDLRGRAPVGAGQGAGLTQRVVGTKWGVEAVVLSLAQVPAHSHVFTMATFQLSAAHGYNPVYPGATDGFTGVGSGTPFGSTMSSSGGGGGHDNTQPSIAIPSFIYAGV